MLLLILILLYSYSVIYSYFFIMSIYRQMYQKLTFDTIFVYKFIDKYRIET